MERSTARKPGRCLQGHTLVEWIAKRGCCDGCNRLVVTGAQVMDCRTCNWYLCEACSVQEKAQTSGWWAAFTFLVNSAAMEIGELGKDLADMASAISCSSVEQVAPETAELSLGSPRDRAPARLRGGAGGPAAEERSRAEPAEGSSWHCPASELQEDLCTICYAGSTHGEGTAARGPVFSEADGREARRLADRPGCLGSEWLERDLLDFSEHPKVLPVPAVFSPQRTRSPAMPATPVVSKGWKAETVSLLDLIDLPPDYAPAAGQSTGAHELPSDSQYAFSKQAAMTCLFDDAPEAHGGSPGLDWGRSQLQAAPGWVMGQPAGTPAPSAPAAASERDPESPRGGGAAAPAAVGVPGQLPTAVDMLGEVVEDLLASPDASCTETTQAAAATAAPSAVALPLLLGRPPVSSCSLVAAAPDGAGPGAVRAAAAA